MNILFLCTGNACRSQMAEGWGRQPGGDALDFAHAGIQAYGQDPRVLAVMGEAGIDVSDQDSTRLTDDLLAWADRVVTVCGHADEHCPVLPPEMDKEQWPLSDPAKATGPEAEIMVAFRATRDEIRDRMADLCQWPLTTCSIA